MKILCVDDEINELNNVFVALSDNPLIDVSLFSRNYEEVKEFARSHIIDLAILDIKLLSYSGLTLAKELILINKNIKIIFITGYLNDENKIKNEFKNNVLSFLYKPVDIRELKTNIISFINNRLYLTVKCFNGFECYLNNDSVAIEFLSAKSKELLAYLVHKEGRSVSMNEAICALYPDKDIEKSKILYRDAVWKLRKSLEKYKLDNLITYKRAMLKLNKEYAKVDYYDFLNGKTSLYNGEYLPNYSWSLERQLQLDDLAITILKD